MPKHEGIAIDPQADEIEKQQVIEASQDENTEVLPAVPEGHMSMTEGLELYKKTGVIPKECALSGLSKIVLETIIEKHAEIQNDPNREPTAGERLAAKRAERAAVAEEKSVVVEEKSPVQVAKIEEITQPLEEIVVQEPLIESPHLREDIMAETPLQAITAETDKVIMDEIQKSEEVIPEASEITPELTVDAVTQAQPEQTNIEVIPPENTLIEQLEPEAPEAPVTQEISIQEDVEPLHEIENVPSTAIETDVSEEQQTPEQTLFHLLETELIEQEQPEPDIVQVSSDEIQSLPVALGEMQSLQQHIEALTMEDKSVATELFEEVTKVSVELGSDTMTVIEREKAEEHLETICKQLFEKLGFDVSSERLQQIVRDIVELSTEAIDQHTSLEALNAAGTYEHRLSVFSKVQAHLLALAAKKLQLHRALSTFMLAGSVAL